MGTHTLRHSAARYWLSSGIPINVVSRWLGHASLQTTLVYLEILPDPLGEIEIPALAQERMEELREQFGR